jgi:hypothetical protein
MNEKRYTNDYIFKLSNNKNYNVTLKYELMKILIYIQY